MTLQDAVSRFEAMFVEISSDEKQQYNKDIAVTWSGGRRTFDQTAWALYATKESAILQWLDTAITYAEGPTLKWLVKPELIEYMITIADQRGQHRAVSNRFTVKSQFVTESVNV